MELLPKRVPFFQSIHADSPLLSAVEVHSPPSGLRDTLKWVPSIGSIFVASGLLPLYISTSCGSRRTFRVCLVLACLGAACFGLACFVLVLGCRVSCSACLRAVCLCSAWGFALGLTVALTGGLTVVCCARRAFPLPLPIWGL